MDSAAPLSRSARAFARCAPATLFVLLAGFFAHSAALAQGSIGFAQKARDNERKWAEDLPIDDLRQRALVHIFVSADELVVVEGNVSKTSGQRADLLGIDFGKAQVDLTSAVPQVDERTQMRTRRVAMPDLPKKAKKIEFQLMVHYPEGDSNDKDLKCKMEHSLPLAAGEALEIFLFDGVETSFYCRDLIVTDEVAAEADDETDGETSD